MSKINYILQREKNGRGAQCSLGFYGSFPRFTTPSSRIPVPRAQSRRPAICYTATGRLMLMSYRDTQVSSSARRTAPCTPSERQSGWELSRHSHDSRLDPHCYSRGKRLVLAAAGGCRNSAGLWRSPAPTPACCWAAVCQSRSRSPTWRRQPLQTPANVHLNPSLTLRGPPSRRGSCRLTASGVPTPGAPSSPKSGSRSKVER